MKNLIVIGGSKGAGKNTCASILSSEYGYIETSFAKKLKDVIQMVFELEDWERIALDGMTDEARVWRETPNDRFLSSDSWEKRLKIDAIQDVYKPYPRRIEEWVQPIPEFNKYVFQVDWVFDDVFKKLKNNAELSPRIVMQIIGTDLFRGINANTWCNVLLREEIRPLLDKGKKIVVTDGRFANEACWLQKLFKNDGLIIYVERPGLSQDPHSSEQTEGFREQAHTVIVNDGTVEDLRAKLLEIVSA